MPSIQMQGEEDAAIRAEVHIVIGKRGAGKSALLAALARECAGRTLVAANSSASASWFRSCMPNAEVVVVDDSDAAADAVLRALAGAAYAVLILDDVVCSAPSLLTALGGAVGVVAKVLVSITHPAMGNNMLTDVPHVRRHVHVLSSYVDRAACDALRELRSDCVNAKGHERVP